MNMVYTFADDGVTGFGREQAFIFFASLASCLVPIVLFAFASLNRNDYSWRSRAIVSCALPVLILSIISYRTFKYYQAIEALTNGQAERISGCVRNFSEEIGQHAVSTDRFSISGHEISINSSPWLFGYHTTKNEGGPIREGVGVQLRRVGARIVSVAVLPGVCEADPSRAAR